MTHDVDQPLALYRDPASGTARPAAVPASVREDAESILFHGRRFVRSGTGLMFWDYLVLPNGESAGVLLVDFEVDASLERSQLLTDSSNITRDGYGYHVRLAAEVNVDTDGSQAFGSSLFECDGECVLILSDWHHRGYAFSLDSELIAP